MMNEMKKIKLAAAVLVSLCLGVLGGCGGDAENGGYGSSINVVNVTGKELIAPQYGEDDSAVKKAVAGANDFAFRLSAALAEHAEDDNFICSPYSVWMPLAALVNATNAENKRALLNSLGASGIGEADINKAASRMLYDLTKQELKDYEGYRSPLKIVNAIFVGNDVTLRRDFAQTFMDYYRGNVINVDFLSRDAVDAVNRWASDNTEGLITDVVEQFDPGTVAALTNAIYFSDRWTREFLSEETNEKVFHGPAGDTKAFYMLRNGEAAYYEDNRVQAIPLGFENGGTMYIILPKSGSAAGLLSSMTNEYFNQIQQGLEPAKGRLLLPRFSIDSQFKDELKETLEALGVPLFDAEAAPLRGGLIEEDRPLFVTDTIQKALIKVDEKGTTAAAVTVVVVGDASAGPSPEPTKTFEMVCDKPFAFVLCEYTHDGGDQVLFTGMVNQP